MKRLVVDGSSGALRVEEPVEAPALTTTEVAAISVRDRIAAYIALTKPRIIELLLITTVPAMVAAADGWPSLYLVLTTLVGGALSAGGANAINCYIDRDIDAVMSRTRLAHFLEKLLQPSRHNQRQKPSGLGADVLVGMEDTFREVDERPGPRPERLLTHQNL